MSIAIRVESLSKQYVLRHQEEAHYETVRESISRGVRRWASKLRHPFTPPAFSATREAFWALNDVNFVIRQGERVGVIGRNGAGKSTLLKILSRITEPTKGRITIAGRVGSLLEVGTGFHPELTGRENISLNGAILGMRKTEITRKFDEIVAFAGVERFLDTPVKRYSSGMYVRLAFAVAAHLEPEILIVDEVLAVGDAQFQKKCLGKLRDLGSEGRTVLFVSHNTSSILQLTDSCILLDNGRLAMHCATETCVAHYLQNHQSDGPTTLRSRVSWFTVTNSRLDREASGMGFNSAIVLQVEMATETDLDGVTVIVGFDNSIGARILTARGRIEYLNHGTHLYSLQLDEHNLSPGTYFVSLVFWSGGKLLFDQSQVLSIELVANQEDEQQYGPYITKTNDKLGCFRPLKVTAV